MPEFQLVACHINLGGDRGSVIVRDRFNPVTFPEYLLLQVIHGGEEHVHNAMSTGYVDRDMDAEYDRLAETYGQIVAQVYPGPGKSLPLGNEAMVTFEEVEAGETAKRKALTVAREARKAAQLQAREEQRAAVRAKRAPPPGVDLPEVDLSPLPAE